MYWSSPRQLCRLVLTLCIAVMTPITRRWSWFVADISILLALTVFQTIVNTSLPLTSDAVPLFGTLFVFHVFRDVNEHKTPWVQGWGHVRVAFMSTFMSVENMFPTALECESMPNAMAAQPNIAGAMCESSVIPFPVPRHKVWLTPTGRVPCSHTANMGERKTWTQSEFCTWQNSVRGKSLQKRIYSVMICMRVCRKTGSV